MVLSPVDDDRLVIRVVVQDPVVDHRFVVAVEVFQAAGKATPHDVVRDMMPLLSHAGGNTRDRGFGVGKLQEIERDSISGNTPSADVP